MKYKLLFLPIVFFFSISADAQFNQQLLYYQMSFIKWPGYITPLEDINHDGFDDFIVYDCSRNESAIFLGGNPVNNTPALKIAGRFSCVNVLDVNNDNFKDMVYITFAEYPDKRIRIYYGGPSFDTIPDIIFTPPGAQDNFGMYSAVTDFNGDGREELLVFNPDSALSGTQNGNVFFFFTDAVFDTIPNHILRGEDYSLTPDFICSGDINGDGKTDISFYCKKRVLQSYSFFRIIIMGNSSWNFNTSQTFYKPVPYNPNVFDPTNFYILQDVNKDGKDDILIHDYGFYPYYYKNAIVLGKSFVDTIPSFGINTQNQGLYTIVSLGDVNNDGYQDFYGQTPSPRPNVMLWVGGRQIRTLREKEWLGTEDGFGGIIGKIGDINGDGADDIAIGKTYDTQCYPGGGLWVYAGDTSVHAITFNEEKGQIISPKDFKLYEPYPNPFNPTTVISWYIPKQSRLKISVYDMIGRELCILFQGESYVGKNQVEFDADKYNLASGVYYIQLEAINNDQIIHKETKKVSYIK